MSPLEFEEKNNVIVLDKEKIAAELLKSLENYRKNMAYMAADAPLSILNIPKSVQKVLNNQGIERIYDLIDLDFTKIIGISESRIAAIKQSVDEFLSML